MKIPEAYRDAFRAARRAGWTITRGRGSSHLHWRSPGGQLVVTASTPSDWRGRRNDLARLRRAGLRVLAMR